MSAAGQQTMAPSPWRVLEEGLSAHLGRPVTVVGWHSRPVERSSHAIERVQVALASGEQLSVLFKRLQPHQKKEDGNDREVLIYQRLLRGQRFDAPALFASSYDENQCYWLFLEDVGETTLSHGEWGDWLAAVRWLARLHGTYLGREEELRALGCLGEHGPEYYWSVAFAARKHLEQSNPRPVLARFDERMEHFPALVAHMVRRPRALVHGDIFPENIHLQPGPRVRPIDWESAAVGAPLWDLARLLDGWGSDKPALLKAYLAELARQTGARARWAALRQTWRCCAILNVLWHLAWDAGPCADPEFVDSCLREIETVSARLHGGGSDV
jgi:thiamine kinase-like enzyme